MTQHENGWYCCPHCGQKLFKTCAQSRAEKITVFCKRCKREHEAYILPRQAGVCGAPPDAAAHA